MNDVFQQCTVNFIPTSINPPSQPTASRNARIRFFAEYREENFLDRDMNILPDEFCAFGVLGFKHFIFITTSNIANPSTKVHRIHMKSEIWDSYIE